MDNNPKIIVYYRKFSFGNWRIYFAKPEDKAILKKHGIRSLTENALALLASAGYRLKEIPPILSPKKDEQDKPN